MEFRRLLFRSSAALLLLEEAALRREELLARDELKRLLLGRQAKDNAGSAGARARLDAVLALEGQLSRPAELLSSGYGLPQRAEREALAAQAAQRAQRLREQGQRLHRDARSLLPRRQREALDAIEANIALLGSRLRQLHRESGGLDLDRLSDLP